MLRPAWLITPMLCLFFGPCLFAWQIADGSPPATFNSGSKYIFYWGKLQCELTPNSGYIGKMSCSTSEFRQMLHSTPYLWTGTSMAQSIAFKLEGQPVAATRGGMDYQALIGRLDETIGKKASAGQVLQLTELQLEEGIYGRIDLIIENPDDGGKSQPFAASPASNMLNTRFLQQVVWGREDIYENSNRDFFSENEFWQTIQQLPFVEWSSYAEPQPVRASIRFSDQGETVFGVRTNLEAAAYRGTVESLSNYRHLVAPGSIVTLSLHTANQYDRLFEKNMYIVPDNDPRLALRRDRDTHTLKIKWSGWAQIIDNLYLLNLSDAAGNAIIADPPMAIRDLIREDELATILSSRPEFWIDGQAVTDMRFHLTTPLQSLVINPDDQMPEMLMSPQQDSILRDGFRLQIDSLYAPGYAIPEIVFSLNFYNLRENLRVRNTFDALLAAPGTGLVTLHSPVSAGAGYAVDLEILKETNAKLSIFKSTGENVFTLDNKYPEGRHTVEIPRIVFRQPGKYFLFLNTTFGVAKQELVLE